MINRYLLSSCAAAALTVSAAAAQTTNQTPTQSPVQGSTQGITGQTRPTTGVANATAVTFTGCVMRAADYMRAQGGATADAGSVRSGVSAGDDFVLSHAQMGAATRSSAEAPSSGQATAGVSGSTSTGREPSSIGTSGVGGGVSAGAGVTDQAGSRPGAAVDGQAGASVNRGNPDAAANTSAAGSAARNDASPDNPNPNPNTNVGDANNPSANAAQSGQSAQGRQATGTSGSASLGTVYTLSGNREAELAQHVGKRIEITGTMDAAGSAATGTSGTRGAAVTQELRITSFRVVPGNCQ